MDKPTCETCPFWDRDASQGMGMGECRKRPPTVGFDSDLELATAWPTTAQEEWCGEHPEFAAYIADQQIEKMLQPKT